MKRRKLKPWMRHEWLFIWTATFVTFLIGAAAITYRASNSSTSKVIRPHDPFGSSDLSSTRLRLVIRFPVLFSLCEHRDLHVVVRGPSPGLCTACSCW